MKRVISVTMASVAILLVTAVSSFLAFTHVQASTGSSTQMISKTFGDPVLFSPPNITGKMIVGTIPFKVPVTSKLEVTSLMSANFNPSSDSGQVTCEFDLDNISFSSVVTSLYKTTTADAGMTSVKTGIAAGSHTLALACMGNSFGGSVLFIHSLGTSVIITS